MDEQRIDFPGVPRFVRVSFLLTMLSLAIIAILHNTTDLMTESRTFRIGSIVCLALTFFSIFRYLRYRYDRRVATHFLGALLTSLFILPVSCFHLSSYSSMSQFRFPQNGDTFILVEIERGQAVVVYHRPVAAPKPAFRTPIDWARPLGLFERGTLSSRGGKFYHSWWRLPMWPVEVLMWATLIVMWRMTLARVRLKPQWDLCHKCGYSLRGSVSSACSECGTAIPEELRKRLQERTATAPAPGLRAEQS